MKELSDSRRGALFGLLLGAVAIVLLTRAAIGNVQLGPFEISEDDLTFV